jgi:hypothetical protein
VSCIDLYQALRCVKSVMMTVNYIMEREQNVSNFENVASETKHHALKA